MKNVAVAARSGMDLKTEIVDADVAFIPRKLKTPLHLSSGTITELTEALAVVTVRVAGREARGRGSIYLSDVWAWPDRELTHEFRDEALRGFCKRIAGELYARCGGVPAHPLVLGMRLHESVASEPSPPILSRAMCASPFDAAIHDAVGIAAGVSAFGFYAGDTPFPEVDGFFSGGGACAAIQRLFQPPRSRLPAWWVVGSSDELETELKRVISKRGYRCFKLKIMGRDNAADAARTVEVYRAARGHGVTDPALTVDSNEANPDAESVLDYLERLRAVDGGAFRALKYLEQPTGRDILLHPQDWRAVTRLKPVFLDEGLTSLSLLEEAKRQGWSGLALKTCKGHSFALVAAAWARENGMRLALQDLTNPGLSAIHAALFASHVPMVNGVEINSPQYTPDANAEWLPRLAGIFQPVNGLHRLASPETVGLGSTL
jgi:L-alanine-DL-glutamate epimerase-like enolase superfamily enzyme